MKYAQLFPKTIKETPASATLISHQLLYRAGFIRESTAGRYYLLPLGLKVHQKIQKIIKEEMDKTGAQELVTPVLHPLELWQETNRSSSVGFELMKIADRNKGEFVLGGTAEEMIVDLVRKFKLSYKDLPLNLYQFSTKFRDEMRARGGLLRVREFIMKDAYSFDVSEEAFKKEYKKMWETYTTIFKRLGLDTTVVESDNGYIGGDYCHEFVVESEVGESKYLTTDDGTYAAHEDVANSLTSPVKNDDEAKPMEEVEGKGIIGVTELAKFLKIPVEKTTKTILFQTDGGAVIAAAIRGDFDINETKLTHAVGCNSLELASAEIVKKVTGAEVGYAGILNLHPSVKIYFDKSTKGRNNFETGANKTDYHTINVNFGRDLPAPKEFYDFKLAKGGYMALNGKPLQERKGIEVGNIFQLGHHYTKKMKGATFTDADGKEKPYYMGCYGIGVGRTLAAIIEIHHDDNGMIWPKNIAPFQVHLIGLSKESKRADLVYRSLQADGYDVLYDDRSDISAGEKFATSDLLGIPVRLVVSDRTGDNVEVKLRGDDDSETISYQKVVALLNKFYE